MSDELMDDTLTELTIEDIENFVKDLMDGKHDIKMRPCWKCSKDFYPNYHHDECDECFFSKFPKDQVEAFYRSFF